MNRIQIAHEATGIAIDRFDCVETAEFTSAAGIRANRKINLEKIPENCEEFRLMVDGLTALIEPKQAELVTAVANGANKWGRAVAWELGLPFAEYIKLEDGTIRPNAWPEELKAAYVEAEKIAVVEDVRSTNFSMIEHADWVGTNRVVLGVSPVDRGQDILTVHTHEDAQRYMRENPTSPPPHITSNFPIESLYKLPMGMYVPESAVAEG